MSAKVLSQTQIGQLRTMLIEHGSEAIFFGLGEIAKQERLNEKGTKTPIQKTKKISKARKKENKKADQLVRAQELAVKIKATHDLDVDPSKFTLKSLTIMLRTGEMQKERTNKKLSNYMRFLANERKENKKLAEPLNSKQLMVNVGEKWRQMSSEEKKQWNSEPIVNETSTVIVDVSEKVEEPTKSVDTTVSEKAEEPKKPIKKKKAKKEKKMTKKQVAEFLIEKHGWDAKLLKKFTVAELRIAKETGKLPTEEMEKRKATKKTKTKKVNTSAKKKVEEKVVEKVEEKVEEKVVEKVVENNTEDKANDKNEDLSILGMFDMSDSDDDEDEN